MNEKGAFGKRLTRLLNEAGIGTASPTDVAREFNRRYLGKPVTAQAVRKWINGDSIPAGDKIRTLAKWLKTSPLWLHYGENEKNASVLKTEEERSAYGEEASATLPEDYQRLTPKHKIIVCEIVQALLRAEKH
jgi:transcriptional regulator with XRE-family HTH domain